MKVTVMTKVCMVLKKYKKAMRMSQICKELENEHSAPAIRGIIYRHLKTAEEKKIKQVSKGVYASTEGSESESKEACVLTSNVVSFEQHLRARVQKIEENVLGNAVGFGTYPSVFNRGDVVDISSRILERGYMYPEGTLPGMSDRKKISAVTMAGGNSSYEREENDFYATNPETVRLFLKEFRKDNELAGSFLECACGQGHMAEVLKETYPDSEVVATDLVDRGYGQGGIDFLKHDYKRTFDNIITNPPFKHIKRFIEKGLEVANKFVIMLGRIQVLEGVTRKEFLKNSPLKYVYVHSKRQATWKNGESTDSEGKPWSTALCLAWFVWEKEYKGEPVIRWI